MHPDDHMYHTLKLWAKSFLSFTDANHVETIGGPCSLKVPTSVEIQKLYMPYVFPCKTSCIGSKFYLCSIVTLIWSLD